MSFERKINKHEDKQKSMVKKKMLLLVIILFSLFSLTVCTLSQQGEQKQEDNDELNQIYCTAEVKECPDGSFVARNPEKNCEFQECP